MEPRAVGDWSLFGGGLWALAAPEGPASWIGVAGVCAGLAIKLVEHRGHRFGDQIKSLRVELEELRKINQEQLKQIAVLKAWIKQVHQDTGRLLPPDLHRAPAQQPAGRGDG